MPLYNVGSASSFEKATTGTATAVALTANTSATALAANANRKFALFTNNGTTDIFLNLGATATANNGIPVKAGGGSYAITQVDMYTGVVSAICGSAASLLVVEAV